MVCALRFALRPSRNYRVCTAGLGRENGVCLTTDLRLEEREKGVVSLEGNGKKVVNQCISSWLRLLQELTLKWCWNKVDASVVPRRAFMRDKIRMIRVDLERKVDWYRTSIIESLVSHCISHVVYWEGRDVFQLSYRPLTQWDSSEKTLIGLLHVIPPHFSLQTNKVPTLVVMPKL